MRKTFKVKFKPEGKSLIVPKDTPVVKAAEKADIIIELPCGGKQKCGKCKIQIKKGEFSVCSTEKSILSDKEIKDGIRLACCSKITSDAEIYIPDSVRLYPEKVLSYNPTSEKNNFPLSPSILQISDIDIFGKNIFGAAFDIGTTTIEASLIDLNSGKEISRIQSENPQIAFGSDIISRLEYIRKEKNNLEKLHNILISQMNKILDNFTNKKILHITCAGNTFIQYVLTNTYPKELFDIPFKTEFKNIINIKARKLGLKTSKDTVLTLIPGIEGFVGSDTSSVIISSGIYKTKNKILAIDMGTNGELVLSVNGKLTSTSCACGPALEGGHITSGVRAKPGAIESFIWKDSKFTYQTIGNKKPTGICGSGLIDIIAYLKEKNYIEPNGRLKKDPFKITDKIKITQQDIRQFQLAKAAIRSAIILLLEKEKIDIKKLNKILIAGNFGNFANPENMIKSTLLPKEFKDKIKFIGNASLSGAKIVLCSKQALEKVKDISQNTKFINLAEDKTFQDKFVEAINFID